eukprot:403360783
MDMTLDLTQYGRDDPYQKSTQYFDEINKKNIKQNKYLTDKFTPQKILNTIEKIQLLEIEREIKEREIIMPEFVQIFLKHMNFAPKEKVYVTIGLIELFKEVKEYEKKFHPQYTTQQTYQKTESVIKWTALTGYFIDNVIQGGNMKTLVPNKYISKNTSENFKQVYASKQLDQFSPEIIGGSSLCLRRFKQSQKLIDSCHHNQGIRNVEYVKDLKMILVLDNLTDEIHFYNEQSVRVKSIKPKSENHIIDTGILFFTYSVQEKRLGACLQDYSLAFWDQADNFTFEKTFNPHLEVLQIYIKYVEYCTTWLTVDQRNQIYIWDIEKETAQQFPKRHEERITDLCEITHLRLLAACSLDKKIIFWDVIQRLPVQILKLEGVSSHSMCYCQDFRVLITAQYENSISIWSFEGKDCSLLSKMKGHNAQVTSIQMLKDTPLLISADEIGFLKTWDIRNCQCVQTVHFECKSSIHQFININDQKFIGIEYRLHWFEFEDKAIVNANGIEFLNMSPISIRYNQLFNQLCIATKSDIRVINIRNGQTEKIIANLVKDEDGEQSSDLTQFIISQDSKKFVVGDNKGNIRTYLYKTSQLETINQGHHQEITNIRLDDRNGLLLSAGWDSSIMIQKFLGQKIQVHKKSNDLTSIDEKPDDTLDEDQFSEKQDDTDEVAKSQIMRLIKNSHFGQEISAIQVSIRLSMIATASSGAICIWDYETLRLIGAMTNKFTEILVLEFLDPFPLLCSLDAGGQIIIWEKLQQFSFSFKIYQPHIVINFNYNQETLGFITQKNTNQFSPIPSKFVKNMLTSQDFEKLYTTENDRQHPMFSRFYDSLDVCNAYQKQKKSMVLVISDDQGGNVFVLDIQSILSRNQLDVKSINAVKRREYNSMRTINLGSNGMFNSQQELAEEFEKVQKQRQEAKLKSPIGSSLRRALSKKFFESTTALGIPQAQQMAALSPQVIKVKDIIEHNLNEITHYKFKAASEPIFVLTVINIPPKVIITSTNSQIVRIWSLFGEPLCVLDIDQPLPYKWKLKISSYFRRKKKYLEAVDILSQLHQSGGDVSPKKKDKQQLATEAFNQAFEKPTQKNLESKRQSGFSIHLVRNTDEEVNQDHYMMLSHQRFFQNENESVTFQKFLHKIEEEDKLLKNPKNYSLKIMEARKTKPSHDHLGVPHNHQKQLDNLAGIKGANRQTQGSNIAQFSLLDKIESIINQPKKLDPKTKQWEQALDEDFNTIKKAKIIQQKQEEAQREINLQIQKAKEDQSQQYMNELIQGRDRRSSTFKLPRGQYLTKNESFKKINLKQVEKKETNPKILQIVPLPTNDQFTNETLSETNLKQLDQINHSKFEPPEENQNIKVHDKSISSYQSAHVITLFGEKKKLKIEQSSLGNIPTDYSRSINQGGGKTKKDWMAYAHSKLDSMQHQNIGNFTNRESHDLSYLSHSNQQNLNVKDLRQKFSSNQSSQLETQRLRTKIFKELDSKRKYYRRNFATVKDFEYLENMEMQDDAEAYEPPQFIKDLNAAKQQFGVQGDPNTKKNGFTPRAKELSKLRLSESQDRIGSLTQRGANNNQNNSNGQQKGLLRNGSTLLPNIKSRL